MKVAVVYNRESQSVINLFGIPNKEKIGRKTIDRVVTALRNGGHHVTAIEGDKDLIDRLEEFMPRVVKGERPGMVFNVSYGIQGQARYTHVPSILEMVGIPYVASGPLAHSLSLDKVVTKMILRQHGLPTPDFAVLSTPDMPLPGLRFPLIVKPKHESVSFGLKVVGDDDELREASGVIFREYGQPVLVERYIEGREVNVGLLGNNPPEAFPPVELIFPDGQRIYTHEDKTGRSGRTISRACPAAIGDELLGKARDLAIKAFQALGCSDCARVDMRLDKKGDLHILEINSLPSLGEHGSYLVGADRVGLDFAAVINRLVEVASARYFGTPEPPVIHAGEADPSAQVFAFITQRRDAVERRVKDWTALSSRSGDPVGLVEAGRRAGRMLEEMRLLPVEDLTDERVAVTWQTRAGLDGGTLFVAPLDIPSTETMTPQRFRREPEWLYGEGIASRASLVALEFALRSIRSLRRLGKQRIGILLYMDEGRDARYSEKVIRQAAARAARVLVLRPGHEDAAVTRRRGLRIYRLRVEGKPRRPGRAAKKPEVLRWVWNRLEAVSALTDQTARVSVSAVRIDAEALPLQLPHRVTARLLVTYPDGEAADDLETRLRETVAATAGPAWELERLTDRPAFRPRRSSMALARKLEEAAQRWEIPFKTTSAVWPSVAGLVPEDTPCLCGVGPTARHVGTPQESVSRTSLIQRSLLLAQLVLDCSSD